MRGARLLPLLVDGAAWVAGLLVAVHTRFDFIPSRRDLTGTTAMIALAVTLQATVGHARQLYRGRYRFASFDEVHGVATTTAAVTFVLTISSMLISEPPAPVGVPAAGGAISLVLMMGARYLRRLQLAHRLRPDRRTAAPVVLFGAGSAGAVLVHSMLHDPKGRYLPAGLIDDDPDKRRLRIHGVPVLGGRDDIGRALADTGAELLIFAVANANAGLVREIRDRTLATGAAFKVVPSVSELMDQAVQVGDIREVQVTDLLGRHQIDTDLTAIGGYLTGKRVLVTGAGGSIGSELCRQIHHFRPAELLMLDRDETSLLAVQLSIDAQARLDDPAVILADVRDAGRMREIFRSRRPQVVFHAAALKHLALLQRHPGEAMKTNVMGTLNVLEASGSVERFVNISTDKAADPTSVLGYSKRITERLTAWTARRSRGTFLSVRFGNVLGSRGSVFTTFSTQIAEGGPVTVTHPDVTRYFMTTQEAVHLVIQAAAIGADGEALVLEMGDPVRIAEVARQMVALSRKPVPIVYTGLRDGEKLSETLFGAGEVDRRPLHPLISHVAVPPVDPNHLIPLPSGADPPILIAALAETCALPAPSATPPATSGATPSTTAPPPPAALPP
ncbi:dTDP-glucose 4,6-dehydratase [Actinoplanes philippinensis]|uniref:NDP-sugar epimerase, includes UDP-GlcNAc-inverting 4,6-dehydratase FlaA1 and capsular polysaccharide biosynthesis protein EpsC n=1 Tax=Actinoplanes philippinensis TaxID=35752 RepID=A0A1I2I644_9ACTN|nr:nucleoside-diphosphate sugar epimerase/dehydratase [Actinoplanes philippinensis]GIE78710.1 dTDP-glucose 4,6-dehydratase [Actinoplanes philippinensis]SFF36366.1 NDP-sugar epimerase, includes UDP-GlcNAc-inverting 4,6-dehydratase FlaA1 and capsular polysaccharide biosynthesis protein EpsC [Actinoplanes philippinensis]